MRAERLAELAVTRSTSLKRGLPPVLARDTRVLILGSFPGEASLAAKQYYAHPRNHFWPLIGALLDVPLAATAVSPSGSRRCARIGIGLWDVIVACERRGSLDGAIRNAEHGEIERVRRVAPSARARLLQRQDRRARRACVARRGLRDAGAAVVVTGVHAAIRGKARRLARDSRRSRRR